MGWGAGGDRQVSGAWDRADVREILMFMEGGIRRVSLLSPGQGWRRGMESRLLCGNVQRLGAVAFLGRGFCTEAVWLQGENGCHQHAGHRQENEGIPPP